MSRPRGRPKTWTPEQEEILCREYPRIGEAVGVLLGKTAKAVSQKAARLGVRRIGSRRRDGPLIRNKHEKRNTRWCFGHIPEGAAPSVFHLARSTT